MGLPKSRGSTWRKWDLHLHSPGTKKSDGYKLASGDVWDEYCRIVHESDVHVFGITDYFSADGYIRAREEYKSRYPSCKKLFFANIELCLSASVNKNDDYVNIHVIFSPQTSDAQLKRFLGKLQTNKTDGKRPIYASDLLSTADFNAATTTHQFIDAAMEDAFSGERLDNALVVAAVNNDGIRPVSGVAKREAISLELDKFSDAFFGNDRNTKYYLGEGRYGDGQTARPKAVVTGSDAHSFDDLNSYLGKTCFNKDGIPHKQPTWIKADVSFEGLKQIVFEPEGRVYIGDEPAVLQRLKRTPRKYVSSISMSQVPTYDGRFGSWFQNETIELSPELVAIIGNKGNGKSAVTDILGLLGNSHKQRTRDERPEELFSFLNKEKFLKQNCAANFQGVVNWQSGAQHVALLNAITDFQRPEEIEYLPQKYLEKICGNVEDGEFRGKLNEVIFHYVPPNKTYKKDNLDDLIEYLTNQANADIRQAEGVLHERNKDVVHLEKKLTAAYASDIDTRISAAQNDLAAHDAIRPVAVDPPPQEDPQAATILQEVAEIEASLDEAQAERESLTEEQTRLSKTAQDLEQVRQAIERPIAELAVLAERHRSLLESASIPFDQIVSVTFDPAPIITAIERANTRVVEISPLLATIEDIELKELLEDDLTALDAAKQASIEWRISSLQRKRSELIDSLGKQDREYQAYLLREQAWSNRRLELYGNDSEPAEGTLSWLLQEQQRIREVYRAQLEQSREKRNEASKKIYSLKKGLLTFYNEIKAAIDKEIKSHTNELGGYNIGIESDLRLDSAFIDDFFHFISQQKKGSFYGTQDGRAELQRIVELVSSWQDEDVVYSAIDAITRALDVDGRPSQQSARRDIFDQLRQGKDAVDFYDFVFGLSYLSPFYELKVDGKTLKELSPGERGGVLLVFYLMLDKRDIPLVIDQPEDNLDNKSVYEILVKFLKQAKRRRQIIIATHNPNLAVVADAEQIINVRIDKSGVGGKKNDFEFASGAIEDLVINKLVVDILEGTPPAFDNRRLKYRKR